MIVTVSPNIALDRVRVIRGFHPGKQSRGLFEFLQPGGSGVHATSVIQSLGGKSIALGLVGGYVGELWKTEATQHGLVYDVVAIPNETRESFCLIDLDQGSVVESVVEGPQVDLAMKEALLARLQSYLPETDLVILSGSLPPGMPFDTYFDMINLARRYGVQTLADIHSAPLRNAIPARPWLIKPNLSEFHELIGSPTQTLAERIQASQVFYQETGITLALSMSGEGLLLTASEGQWLLAPPEVRMHLPDGNGQNVIGCGDALVGALAYEVCQSRNLLAGAALGLAAAHYNLSTFGVPEIRSSEARQLASQVQIQRLRP